MTAARSGVGRNVGCGDDTAKRGCEDAKIERVALFVKLIFIFIIIFR